MALAVGVAALALGGCASIRVDDQGATHLAGWMWLTLPPAPQRSTAAHTLRARTIGLTLTRDTQGLGLLLGVGDQWLATIYNNSLLAWPPAGSFPPQESTCRFTE